MNLLISQFSVSDILSAKQKIEKTEDFRYQELHSIGKIMHSKYFLNSYLK